MKRLASAVILVLVSFCAVEAQVRRLPKFTSYPAKVEKPRAKGVDLKHDSGARAYRTRLSNGFRRGVNFAGHYMIVGWGCGTGCTNAAVIDARTGKVLWPEEFFNLDATYGDGYSDEQIEFKKNSRLMIIHGVPGGPDDKPVKASGDHYYEWKGDRFKLLRSVPKTTN